MTKYVKEFYSLNCAPDILKVIPDQKDRLNKEITESMAIRKKIKSACIAKKEYYIVDLCAGNGLTGILIAYTLPIHRVIACDLYKRNGNYKSVRNYNYIEKDINNIRIEDFRGFKDIIIVASHACRQSAIDIINIYNKHEDIKGLVMIPCCIGKHKADDFLLREIGKYKEWCFYLKQLCSGKLSFDNYILSPCNGIVEAWK